MDNTITTVNINVRTLEADPQYFGGYLNMARLNVFNISNHIADKLSLKKLNNDEGIRQSFLCNGSSKVNWRREFAITRRFMPIVKVFDSELLPGKSPKKIIEAEGKDFKEMDRTLQIVFDELQQFRNDYSHYASTSDNFERKIEVSKELADFLTINFNRAIEYTKLRCKDSYRDEDFYLAAQMQMVEGNRITTAGLVFLTSLFLEREQAYLFIGKVKGLKGTHRPEFIATREVFTAFCVTLPHDKFVSEDFKQQLTLDFINELNKCPYTLYNVMAEDQKQVFIPQLGDAERENVKANSINENDIPDEADYDQYVESITKKVRYTNRFFYFALRYIDEMNVLPGYSFQIDLGKLILDTYPKQFSGEDVERRIVDNVTAFGKLSSFRVEKEVLKQILKVNDSAGFDQFAPHYNMDINKIGLSSKNDTGKVIDQSNKDLKSRFKLIQPQPELFLSLHELYKIILLEYLSEGEAKQIIKDFVLVNSQKLMNMDFINKIKSELPQNWRPFKRKVTIVKRDGTKKNNNDNNDNNDKKNKKNNKNTGYTDEEFDELTNRKAEVNRVLSLYNLNIKQIPSRILDFWLHITDVDNDLILSQRIKSMRRDCVTRLKAFHKFEETEKGKVPKIGEMASFLARDIINMVIDKDKKEKITSFYYDKLQECIALFADPEMKKMFIHIVQNELNLFSAGGHPFLGKINLQSVNYTSDLYVKYLEEKGCKKGHDGKLKGKECYWIYTTFYKLIKDPDPTKKSKTKVGLPKDRTGNTDIRLVPYTLYKLGNNKEDSLENWLSHLKEGHKYTKGDKTIQDKKKPVDLPTNLFDNRIEELLLARMDKKRDSFDKKINVSKLLCEWWKTRGDDTQSFYKDNRKYVVFDQEVAFTPNSCEKYEEYYKDALNRAFEQKTKERKIEKRSNSKLPDIQFIQVKKTFEKSLAQTEKEIRILQEEDRILVLMLERLMGDDSSNNLSLKNVRDLLDEEVIIRQPVTGLLSFDENGEKVDNPDYSISKVIISNGKRKNYGLLRKFIHDRRMPELFEYYTEDEIAFDSLKQELTAYNNAKQVLFDKVFELERAIIEKSKKEVVRFIDSKNDKRQFSNIQHSPYLDYLKANGVIDNDDHRFFRVLRNCFSHNQFPHKKTMDLFVKQWNSNNFATQILEIYNQKISDIIQRI